MSLTDKALRELCKRMDIPLADICFKDDLPKKLEFNKAYIINLEDEYDEDGKRNGGSHWTTLQLNKYPNGKEEGIYFDPYGVGKPQDIKMLLFALWVRIVLKQKRIFSHYSITPVDGIVVPSFTS